MAGPSVTGGACFRFSTRAISSTPEDRQPPASETKPSIFGSKPTAVIVDEASEVTPAMFEEPTVETHIAARIAEETEPVPEPTSEAEPVEIPVVKPKSIFSLGAGNAA